MGLEKYRTVKSWWYMQYSRNHISIKSRFDLYDIKWSNTMLFVNQLAVTWFCFCFQLWLINVRETYRIVLDFIVGEDVLGTTGVDNDLSSNMTFHSFSFWTCSFTFSLQIRVAPSAGWSRTIPVFILVTSPIQRRFWHGARPNNGVRANPSQQATRS